MAINFFWPRVNESLTENYNWFKSKKVNDETEDNGENVNKLSKQSKCKWNHYRKKSTPIEALEKVKQKDSPAQAVLFVQYTDNGELASRIRDVVQQLRPWTGINIKIVERVGQKLEDVLHKSNPWENLDCNRKDCFSCLSSASSKEPKLFPLC